MKRARTVGIVLGLLVASVLVVLLIVAHKPSHDGAPESPLRMETGEKADPTAHNTPKPSRVEEKVDEKDDRDTLTADVRQVTSHDVRKWQRDSLDESLKEVQKEQVRKNRYQSARQQARSLYGSLLLPEGLNPKEIGPVKLQLRTTEHYARVGETMLDRDGHYAFDPVAPGKYTLLIFENKATPGIQYKNIEIGADQVMPDIDIPSASGVITVHLVDETGNGISGARITVGKTDQPSGSNVNFFTFRIGTSDADGGFVAKNLADGRYVVQASYGALDTSEVVTLEPKSTIDHTLSLRLSGSQIVGTVRRRDPLLDTSYPVILEGADVNGNRVLRSIGTDSKGEYAISYLPAGTYKVHIQQTAQFSGTDALVTITGKKETRRNVDLDVYYTKELSSITGTVRSIGNSPGAMLHVLAWSQNGVLRADAVVNMTSGEFSLKALPPGHYTVKLMSQDKAGERPQEVASQTVYVEPNGSILRMEFSVPKEK
jgi:hypothetical protein